jgi:hypothetical protein
MSSSQYDPRPGQDDTIGGDARDAPSLLEAAERVLRAMPELANFPSGRALIAAIDKAKGRA